MTPELIKKLEEKYPIYTTTYISCDDGWYKIFDELGPVLQKELEENPNFRILQIKEKFGMARIYITGAPENVHKAIEKAEDDSEHICESCGSEEKVKVYHSGGSKHGWIRSLCSVCGKKWEARE